MAAIQLRQICLLARDLYAVVDDLTAVLGVEVCHGKADLTRYGILYEPPPPHSAAFFAKHGLENALLPFGDDFLEIVTPVRPDNAASRLLERRGGDCGYMVIVEVDAVEPYRDRAAQRSIRIAGGANYPQYQDLHLDPRDCGGSMLAFAQQREGLPFDGGWYPAGPKWRERRRDTVRGITAAELACRTPEITAARWGDIIRRPVVDGSLSLDDATLRFVASDASDTLAGIDVHVADAASCHAAARARGLPMQGDAVTFGGVAFRLI